MWKKCDTDKEHQFSKKKRTCNKVGLCILLIRKEYGKSDSYESQ